MVSPNQSTSRSCALTSPRKGAPPPPPSAILKCPGCARSSTRRCKPPPHAAANSALPLQRKFDGRQHRQRDAVPGHHPVRSGAVDLSVARAAAMVACRFLQPDFAGDLEGDALSRRLVARSEEHTSELQSLM